MMSSMAKSGDNWEYSKENILPLQQGRKPEILKHALGEHLEDPIQLQRQIFENELRTYSGDDPLSVWCKYINWVEQNFLRGGRDGHFEELVRKCVSIFKDDKKYYDDKRFITIWLKFANVSGKPMEVYSYMYSNNIGCRSASFFISWSWELEQQNNIKKANQVLREGLNRNADPNDKLKTYLSEFEMRISRKIFEAEQNPDSESHRSAFTILKPKRNTVPVERTGASTIEPTRAAMVINRQQPAPKNIDNCSSLRVPFKIFNADAPASSLPIQKVGKVPFVFHSDSVKENEMKPSKWNKVKLKQAVPINQLSSESNLGFNFHCDDGPQPICTPRSVPKVSNVLRARQESIKPAVALFEPPDPMKQPMYDKNKVYGGGEEFSLEEIRAAAWLKKYNICTRQESIHPAIALFEPPDPMKQPMYDKNKIYGGGEELSFEEIRAFAWLEKHNNIQSSFKIEPTDSDLTGKNKFVIYDDNENKQYDSHKSLSHNQLPKTPYTLPFLQGCENPKRILSSPVNPLRKPIYNRNLLYSGDEELSFEEIKARMMSRAVNTQQLQYQIPSISNQLKDFKDIESSFKEQSVKNNPEKQCDQWMHKSLNREFLDEDLSKNNGSFSSLLSLNPLHNKELKISQDIKIATNVCANSFSCSNLKDNSHPKDNIVNLFETIPNENYYEASAVSEVLQEKGLYSTSYCEAANMLQELYNGTMSNLPKAILENEHVLKKDGSYSSDTEIGVKSNQLPNSITTFGLPFTFYQDPTDCINIKNNENVKPNISEPPMKSYKPFTIYQDEDKNNLQSKENMQSKLVNVSENFLKSKTETNIPKLQSQIDIPFTVYQDSTENNLYGKEFTFKNTESELKSFSENLPENEDRENIPPDDYIQDTTKRELSGILTAAKNVTFIPLEQQEIEDDEFDIQDMDGDNNYGSGQNETLIPPCNTEQFVSAPFTSSTPFTSAKNAKKTHFQMLSTDTYHYQLESYNNEKEKAAESQQVAENATNKQLQRVEKIAYNSRPITSLSVIMETSKESYKSSGSSGSSASVSKLSQIDQYSSYDKNLTHKEGVKSETFKEPKPPGPETVLTTSKKVVVGFSQSHSSDTHKTLHCFEGDPFENDLSVKFLQSLNQPLYHQILETCDENIKSFRIGGKVSLRNEEYFIENLIGEGSYGKVHIANRLLLAQHDFHAPPLCSKFVIKICKSCQEWELYICFTLKQRLFQMSRVPDVQLSVMDIVSAKKYINGILLISEYCSKGTLLDLVNFMKKESCSIPEYLIMYITLELLTIMSKIHKCNIIHTDIKPDNILLCDFPENSDSVLNCFDEKTSLLRFIDFGRSIDLSFFEDGVCFVTLLQNRCFEVTENKPWVFQPDWCGILDCIHALLFSEYMTVKKNSNGRWGITKSIRRYWATDIWYPLFDELLNIPACYEEPNIQQHVTKLKNKLLQNPRRLISDWNFLVKYSKKN